jgi:hypothetical protein
MNRLTMILLFLCVCMAAFSTSGIPSQQEPRPMTDLLGSIEAEAVAATSTAVLIYTGPGYVTIRNMDAAADVFHYGPVGVTATSGMPLLQYEQITIGLGEGEPLYGVATPAATVDVRVLGGR